MGYTHEMSDTGLTVPVGASTRGTVVTYWGEGAGLPGGHERVTLEAHARKLAAIKGYRYGGEYDAASPYDGHVYLVPRETLLSSEARALPIASEADLFGGVVRYPFVATKTITHPLVGQDARAPEGWTPLFPESVREDVLFGFSAFSPEDAFRAGKRVLEKGPARLKLASGIGGAGQATARDVAELESVLAAFDARGKLQQGLVVEQDLTDVTTYSVGQVHVSGMDITYYGTQHNTSNNQGQDVYGGSDLLIVKGDFDTLLGLNLEPAIQLAIRQAMRYDAAADHRFPGFFASRRNYDIVQGLDACGRRRSGVLEQSWRLGGATAAELLALETFLAHPELGAVRASSVEVYGDCDVPPEAVVMFRGIDPRVGSLTKYSIVEPHGHVP